MNKQIIKELFLELVVDGEISLDIPDLLITESIRRNRQEIKEQIDWGMENGAFPVKKVEEMLDFRVDDYKRELKKDLLQYIQNKQIARVKVQINEAEPIETGLQHKQFADLLQTVMVRLNVYLVGPAGGGKTTACEQVAQVMKIPFYFTGAITSEFKLTGFIDAQGRVVCPAFRKAYESGGLFLFDEIDASMAQAVLAFNAAIANGMMDFPDKTVKKHENFYCVAAANTFGQGADRVYVGRNQLDGATIDRFAFIDWEYDEELEQKMANNTNWVNKVQKIRRAVAKHKIRHVVSPRASRDGAKLLAAGMLEDAVMAKCVWKGLDEESKKKVMNEARILAPILAAPALGDDNDPDFDANKEARRLASF